MTKRWFALLLCLALVLLTACAPKTPETPDDPDDPGKAEDPVEEEEIDNLQESGRIGESDLYWDFYADGRLYIRGTGDCPEFDTADEQDTDQPWHRYRAPDNTSDLPSYVITSVTVEEGVTSLSQYMFKNCRYLRTAVLPASLTAISYQCFAGCAALRTVQTGGATAIDENAFDGCASLESVTFCADLAAVEQGAFHSCAAFTAHFKGDEAAWQTILDTAAPGNEKLLSASVVYE